MQNRPPMQRTDRRDTATSGGYGNGYGEAQASEAMSAINVGRDERLLSVLGGAVLMIRAGMRGNRLAAFLSALLGGYLVYRGATGHCYVYESMGVTTAVKTDPSRVSVPHQQGIHVTQAITIDKPVAELYRFWRSLENLPRFMNHLESVTVLDEKRSHWVAKGPAGLKVEWDAEIINEAPNEVIGWRSLKDSAVANAGSVRFKPAASGRGTEIWVELEYSPPAGPLGAAVAALFGEEPHIQIEDDLRRLKQLIDAGEVATL